jgi:hypothetical protein
MLLLQVSEKTPITGGFRKLCKQPKYLYFGAMVIALTFLLSSLLLSEQPRMVRVQVSSRFFITSMAQNFFRPGNGKIKFLYVHLFGRKSKS